MAKRTLIEIPGSFHVVQITDDDSRTLIDPVGEVAFHSGSGALAETRHVYLKNSGVSARLACGKNTSVLEIGLGTGLGMLLDRGRGSGRLGGIELSGRLRWTGCPWMF